MNPLPKRYGKQMPSSVDNGARICFKIEVPDQLEYRAALMGQLNDLGFWFTWDHIQADYYDIPVKNQEVAQLWLNTVADASFEVCMDICSQIINCILTNPDTQQAIRDFVINDPAINQHTTDIAKAQVLTLEQRLSNLLKPSACDPDYLFNQTSVLVLLLHDLAEDMFEAIEVGTNQLERGDILVSAIPAIGGLLPFDEALALGDQLAEEIAEEYSGAYDEGLYDDIRCGLFCLIEGDCTLNIDRAINWYVNKLDEEIPDDPVEAFRALLQLLLIGDFPTDAVVYAMHLFSLMAIRLSQNVLGIDFGKLGMRVVAAGDTPNNDWETLCDCTPTPPPALLIQPFPAWNDSCLWEFIENEGTDEIWTVTMKPFPRSWPSFTGTPANGIPFLVMEWEIVSGDWDTQYEIDGVDYPGTFPNDVPVTGYIAMYCYTEVGKVRFRFRADPFE